MCAYFIVNSVTLYILDRRIRVTKSEEPIDQQDVRYSKLLRHTIIQVDLPCIIPFSIILIYAFGNQINMDWEAYLLGASAVLLFISNILSSALNTLWEEEQGFS